MLKTAAKTRKVAAEEILAAFSAIEKAKVDPSPFLETLGGSESPGRTWMLIFTAEVYYNSYSCLIMLQSWYHWHVILCYTTVQKKLKKGRYFPLTAVQRFDAAVRPPPLYARHQNVIHFGSNSNTVVFYLNLVTGEKNRERGVSWSTRSFDLRRKVFMEEPYPSLHLRTDTHKDWTFRSYKDRFGKERRRGRAE